MAQRDIINGILGRDSATPQNYDGYVLVAERLQQARKKLRPQDGWCFRAYPEQVHMDMGVSVHVAQILKGDKLLVQNVAVQQIPDPAFLPDDDMASRMSKADLAVLTERAINASLAKGDTTAMGRALVLAGFPATQEDDMDVLLREAGLAPDTGVVAIEDIHGNVRQYETVKARLARFRDECDVAQGWGIIIEADELNPQSIHFTASIVHPDGHEVSVGSRRYFSPAGNGFAAKLPEALATQAVGRALGYLGFVADADLSVATADEMLTCGSLGMGARPQPKQADVETDKAKAKAKSNGDKRRCAVPAAEATKNIRLV